MYNVMLGEEKTIDDQQVRLRHLDNAEEEGRKTNDAILSLSTGALALSITFRSALFGTEPSALFLLGMSWIAFTVSVICYVMNSIFKASTTLEMAQGKSFEQLDQQILNYSCKARVTMLVSFLIGVVLLALFGDSRRSNQGRND
jgi:hypothetical protein